MPSPRIGASDVAEPGEVDRLRPLSFDVGTGGASFSSGGSRSSLVVCIDMSSSNGIRICGEVGPETGLDAPREVIGDTGADGFLIPTAIA